MHEQAVRDVLVAAPEVVALVGTRIYPDVAPQGVARPFVILRLVSAVPYHTHDGIPSTLLEAARVQVDTYGTEKAATGSVAKAIDDVLGSLSGEMSATRDSMRSGYEDETSLVFVRADYVVQRTRG